VTARLPRPSGPDRPPRTTLTGWGRSTRSAADVDRPRTIDDVAAAVRAARGDAASRRHGRGLLARGLGRSYGDAAQNAGGRVLDLVGLGSIGSIGADGVVEVGAGVSVGELIDHAVPLGWFVPVTPGTRHVTMGGAVAADVHGKNHHRDASIGAHVVGVTLVDGLGEVRLLESGDELLGAVVGGMGLSGVVTSVRVRMRRVATASITVHTRRTADLEATMVALAEDDQRYPYTVAWLDTLATGRATGRGVVTSGDHTTVEEGGGIPLARHRAGSSLPAPPWAPSGLVNRVSARAFNEAYFRRAPAHPHVAPAPVTTFFHPLDVVGGWNRAYGATGFLQYQLAVADGEVVERVLELLRRERVTQFLPVLKRFGPGIAAPMSFPRPGWTLAVDIPATPDVGPVLDRADEIVVSAGGRCYLAKDGRVRPSLIPVMYPELERWRELRGRLDPDGVFVSDLARRLSLC
jgi:decaprenylphospho-beta-D-ribofuranose 2-oxidase